MSYYRTCPHCGAHLDPDEPCGCADALIGASMPLTEGAVNLWGPKSHAPGILDKKTAHGATNTMDGKEAQHDH